MRQIEREDCGAAALAMVLGYWGLPITRDAISAANPAAPEHGIRAAALRDFARRQVCRPSSSRASSPISSASSAGIARSWSVS